MVNYQLSKIYKIYSTQEPDLCYVGSTTKKYLSSRLNQHRSKYKLWKNEHIDKDGRKMSYTRAYDIFEKYDDYKIELLELYPCGSKDELHAREGYWQKQIKCINKMIAGRKNKEWRKDNEVYVKEYNKKYKLEHKEEIKKQSSAKHLCECGIVYTQGHKLRHTKSEKHQSYINHPTYKLRQTIRRFKEVSEMYKIINGL